MLFSFIALYRHVLLVFLFLSMTIINIHASSSSSSSSSFTHSRLHNRNDLIEALNEWCNGGQAQIDIESKHGPIQNWDVSRITSFESIFDAQHSNSNRKECNPDISNWTTIQVTNMKRAFYKAKHFNQNLQYWDTTNVITFQQMFAKTTNFQGLGLQYWKVQNGEDFSYMFYHAKGINNNNNNNNNYLDLLGWEMENAYNVQYMFAKSTLFNDNLCQWNLPTMSNTTQMFQDTTCAYPEPEFDDELNTFLSMCHSCWW